MQRMPTDRIVTLLNELLKEDASAISCLVLNRVPVNKLLSSHPLVNVWKLNDTDTTIGLLGILNSIMRVIDCEQIVAVYDERNSEIIKHFEIFNPNRPLVQEAKHHGSFSKNEKGS